ncbi:MAG: crossover junction endodeoxyribonuclease RuvC [Kiloniellales bacterium]|nr:crossover junction endodeoxyribonuclease RuvC [Kiloniellales bacterium]
MRVVGLDPGLRRTGWGVIEAEGNRLRHVAHGVIEADPVQTLDRRLRELHEALLAMIAAQAPQEAAVEETLVNRNPDSTLKLGMARGVALLTPALAGLAVTEYLPLVVKKSIVGTGQASKEQVAVMVRQLLPGCGVRTADAADALAVAICHVHHRATRRRWRDRPVAETAAVEEPA